MNLSKNKKLKYLNNLKRVMLEDTLPSSLLSGRALYDSGVEQLKFEYSTFKIPLADFSSDPFYPRFRNMFIEEISKEMLYISGLIDGVKLCLGFFDSSKKVDDVKFNLKSSLDSLLEQMDSSASGAVSWNNYILLMRSYFDDARSKLILSTRKDRFS
jgi:hypothetical protein